VTASSSPAPKPTPRAAKHTAPETTATAQNLGAAVRPAAVSAGSNGKHAAEPSVGKLVSDASAHLSTLIRGEIELAKLELRSSVKNAITGSGLFAAAAVVLVFSLVFGFLTLAEGIAALGLDRWLAFLIVFVLQLVFAGLCVWIGIKKVKKIKAPARTIKSTRETVDYLKKSRG
jgi:uncharacterized membrane protein YqjE